MQVLQDTLAKSFLLEVAFNKHSRLIAVLIKEAVAVHKLLKKTGDVGEKLSSGHKKRKNEFFRMLSCLPGPTIEGT